MPSPAGEGCDLFSALSLRPVPNGSRRDGLGVAPPPFCFVRGERGPEPSSVAAGGAGGGGSGGPGSGRAVVSGGGGAGGLRGGSRRQRGGRLPHPRQPCTSSRYSGGAPAASLARPRPAAACPAPGVGRGRNGPGPEGRRVGPEASGPLLGRPLSRGGVVVPAQARGPEAAVSSSTGRFHSVRCVAVRALRCGPWGHSEGAISVTRPCRRRPTGDSSVCAGVEPGPPSTDHSTCAHRP